MNRELNMEKNAFFSVEAAMVMPLAISAVILAVSLFVFQYNRCLMEQDMAAQTLKAAVVEAQSKEELAEKIQTQTAGLYRNKYVAWDLMLFELNMKKGIVEAVGKGDFLFSIPGWNFWNRENSWNARAGYKAHRISPIAFIRNYRKITGGI